MSKRSRKIRCIQRAASWWNAVTEILLNGLTREARNEKK